MPKQLTEEMIIKRAKNNNLASIRKLNCWGQSLSDIDILSECKSLESATFSKNFITSLKCFQGMNNFISGIKTIVENTSRVLYFQNQFISKQKKEERINSTYNTTVSNFNKNIPTSERNKNLYNKYKEDPKFQYHEMKYNALSKKILNKLDSMMEQVKN